MNQLADLRIGRFASAIHLFILFMSTLSLGCGDQDTSPSAQASATIRKVGESTSSVRGTAAAMPVVAQTVSNSGAKFSGTDSCIECHIDQANRYFESAHYHSFGPTKIVNEIITDGFAIESKARRLEVDKRDGVMVHRDSVLDAGGNSIVVTENPIIYAVGSGKHAKTYLTQQDGFFVESPMTWYRDHEKGWALSPGFEMSDPAGFSRSVTSGCLYCHVGQIDALEGNPKRFEITEHAIGCERCHGPGGDHVSKHAGDGDMSLFDGIVHPAKMDRERGEAICQQCHLQGVALSVQSGGSVWDYRPGDLLTDTRTDFQYAIDKVPMQIVGHVEQLHASECYKQTETLTCITCHNPHQTLRPEEARDFYRQTCLKCHDDDACGVSSPERLRTNQNDCSACHMPSKATNVSHTAFHDHRIAVHAAAEPPRDLLATIKKLVPLVSDAQLPVIEAQRRKALAMDVLVQRGDGNIDIPHMRQIAIERLFHLKQVGMKDLDAEAALANDAWLAGYSDDARPIAEAIVRQPGPPVEATVKAHRLLGRIALDARDDAAALEHYQYVTRFAREALDHYYLALAEQNLDKTENAIASLKRATTIDPALISAHETLQVIYASIGESDLAQQQAELIRELDDAIKRSQLASEPNELSSHERSSP